MVNLKKYKFCGRKATAIETRYDGKHNDWFGVYDVDAVTPTQLNGLKMGKMKDIRFFVAYGDYCGLYEYKTTLICPECAQELGLIW